MLLNDNPPKGFEKFFKPGGAPKNSKEAPKEAPKDTPKESPKPPPKDNPFSRGPEPDKKFTLKYDFKFGSPGGK